MQSPRCQHKNPAGQKFCGECGTPLAGSLQGGRPGASYADLQHALSGSLDQQTATSEILRVISRSQTDVQPVFDAIAESALRLCDAKHGVVFLFDGELIHLAAITGTEREATEAARRSFPQAPGRASATTRAIQTLRAVVIPDVLEDPEFQLTEIGRVTDFRSVMSVPMLRGGKPIGAVTVTRAAAAPFPDTQVALLGTFANQAVIAIENVRLFTELGARNRDLTQALDQQTATADVLRVIGSSPTDAQPVFEAIVGSARRLLDGFGGAVYRVSGDEIHLAAYISTNPSGDAALRNSFPRPLAVFSPPGEAIRRRAPVVLADIETAGWIPDDIRELIRKRGDRSGVWVPMMRESIALGAIGVTRTEPGFTEDQIELLKTFADQAVIAIENVRLFTELQEKNSALTVAHAQVTESLEQQTATSEILRVISSSPTDLQPVLDTVVASAARYCGAYDATMLHLDGGSLRLAAHHGPIPIPVGRPIPVVPGTTSGRAVLERRAVHVTDIQAEAEEFPESRAFAKELGYRTQLSVPLLRKGAAIGTIVLRRIETNPFTDKQIALLQTFADQAVIAIENVRLFTELEARNRDLTEALNQQTATSEVLRVISSSPTDVKPVFDTIVQNGRRLCGADSAAVSTYDGKLIHIESFDNDDPERADALRRAYPRPANREHATGRAILLGRPVQIPDVLEDPEYALPVVRDAGIRSVLAVPMVRDGIPIGAIAVQMWVTPRPYSDEQIGLLSTFADQAVIAIENVRLFKELEARNRDLTATGEILQVISHSPTDIQPVLDAVAESAARLCEAFDVIIFRREDNHLRLVAHHGPIPVGVVGEFGLPLVRAFAGGRAVLDGHTIHVADLQAEAEELPGSSEDGRRMGFRTILCVPLMREGVAIGTINLRRTEVQPFTDKQIALLQTFADQAVIAIENVRLFKELGARNVELTEALEQQTATSEILQVISASPTQLQPVLDAISERAARLCDAWNGTIVLGDGQGLRMEAHYGPLTEQLGIRLPIDQGSVSGRAFLERHPVHVDDLSEAADFPLGRQIAIRFGVRTILAVPLLREAVPIGVILIRRTEIRPFSNKQIALLQTFADQAVIAIENVRLFKELQARTAELTRSVDELTALGEVSQALSSTLDLETVLTTIVSRAVHLSGLDGGVVFEYDDDTEEFVHRAATETGGTLAEARRATRVRKGEGVVGRTAITLEPVQVPDITAPHAYESRLRGNLIESGVRAVLAVPMVRDADLIGCLVVSRNQPGDFPAETVELLRTFATQSALAIQNARLFHEIADKSRQLEAASQHKSEFLANMSHELRTPLNAIIGFSEVLAQGMFGEVNDKQSEYLHDILESGRHLLSLINDILDLSKIEAGRMELELSEFDLPQAIQNALTLVRERALRRGIALHHIIDDQVADIRADERKVKQVLLNLLSNAIKFTPEGGRIDVGARLHDDVAEVSVTDTGIGIAPTDQDTVFEEFRQVGAADKKAEGTGLGLTLSRKFIELHGGKIWVQSEVGRGSTFTFTLPVSPWPAS